MIRFNGHFNGEVITPDQPVDLPVGVPLRITVEGQKTTPDALVDGAPLAALADLAETFPDVQDWPADYATQLDHYLYGCPKIEK